MMTITLTDSEKISLLGNLEDLIQEDDDEHFLATDTRQDIVNIIRKLGGTFFGRSQKWIAENTPV